MKLFVSDMDGTLLRRDVTISPENLDAIAALESRGVTFAIATGRSYVDARIILDRFGVRCPVVCSNGAAVRDADGGLVAKRTIPLDELARLCAYMDEHDIFYGINSTWDLSMLPDWEALVDAEEGATPEKLAFVKEPVLSQSGLRFVTGFASFLSGEEDSCSISLASTDQKKLDDLAAFAALSGKVHLMASGFSSLEITPADCSKASGLRELGETLGIALEEMVSIGDNYNDLEMLLETGRSFAVENAPEDIRAACTGVVPSCYENGVAYAICRVLEEK